MSAVVAEQIRGLSYRGDPAECRECSLCSGETSFRLSRRSILAERMGFSRAQLCEGGLTQVVVEYSGEVANLKLEPMTLAALKGLLSPTLQENVNYVDAPLIAKDRGQSR